MMKKHIIFFISTLDNGGLENYLLRFLKIKGYQFEQITIFCKKNKGGYLERNYLEFPNVKIIKKRIGNFHPLDYLYLVNWFKKNKENIVCDFTGNFAGPILWAAKIAGIKNRIVFYRSSSNRFHETFPKLIVNKFYNRLIKTYATTILLNSKYAVLFYFGKGYSDPRIKVIYNGIIIPDFTSNKRNIKAELNFPPNTIIVGHTGRYNQAKNHLAIVEIAEQTTKKYNNLKYILVGAGVKYQLEKVIQKRGLEQKVILFNNRKDIPQLLNTFDIFLFPSITEGQPNSLIEAWIMGLPFVASNIPPISDIVCNEFKTYLCDPFDINCMVDKVSQLIDQPLNFTQKERLSKWAQNSFNSNLRFQEFLEILLK